jgi:hypothetical protein
LYDLGRHKTCSFLFLAQSGPEAQSKRFCPYYFCSGWINKNQPQKKFPWLVDHQLASVLVGTVQADRRGRFKLNKNATDMGTSVAVSKSDQKSGLTAVQRRAQRVIANNYRC